MPVSPTYPGVYIEEVPSEVRTIVGVATSITAFIGRALRGPCDEPVKVRNFGDFARTFGGLSEKSTMSYAVQQFFLNGGAEALIVRVYKKDGADPNPDGIAEVSLPPNGMGPSLKLVTANPGAWGNHLWAIVDLITSDEDDAKLFNLIIREVKEINELEPEKEEVVAEEWHRNVSVDQESVRYVVNVLESESNLVRVDPTLAADPENEMPEEHPDTPSERFTSGNDGLEIDSTVVTGPDESTKEGLYALEKADLFNLLCIPPYSRGADFEGWSDAHTYCEKRRAMLIVDPPYEWNNVDSETNWVAQLTALGVQEKNAAVFFPWIKMADSLQENRLQEFAPCGAVAGIFARTDSDRGVWKAPAGLDATVRGARELSYKLTDGEQGDLNQLGINCLRSFPVVGTVVWGSRTLRGADRLASEWKYIPVRRLALYIEESLFRGTQWVVFEPNDEPLWSQIRLNIGAFMHNLFRQGAFQGVTPREAYFVKCDKETTTQNDINLGIVNILVGFAPLKPAEFVIIKISQIAGDVQV